MDSRPYNIVLLPPDDIFRKTIKLSKLLSTKFKTEFVVDGIKKYPHATLFQLEIPFKNYEKFLRVLDTIFSLQKKIKTSLDGYDNTESFVSIKLKKAKSLVKLHFTVVDKLNPLREGLGVSTVKKEWKKLPAGFETDFKTYGSLGVLKTFRPHITITRLKKINEVNLAMEKLPLLPNKEIIFRRAALGKLSVHGTVVEIIKHYNLMD